MIGYTGSGSVMLQVLVHGRPVREYRRGGREAYVEGRKGSEFALRVRNTTGRRIEAVVSVDGLSVLDGQPASTRDRGYLVPPYGEVTIPGWRLNDAKVASFYFAALPQAYAAQMGTPANIGVIGAAFFFERRPMAVRPTYVPPEHYPFPIIPFRSDQFGSREARSAPEDVTRGGGRVGTGFGRAQDHQVHEVAFERESQVPAVTLTLRYDTAAELRRLGIQVDYAHQGQGSLTAAEPFPEDDEGVGAVPPPGWHR